MTEQMGWRKGLKLFGERGEKAVEGELQQIHDMEGFHPKHWYELTKKIEKKGTQIPHIPQGEKRWKNQGERMC